jgi:hypothetical protein
MTWAVAGLVVGWALRSWLPPSGRPAPDGTPHRAGSMRIVYYREAGRSVPVCAHNHRRVPDCMLEGWA